MNFILGKRQIVLATLVLGLGIAVYLNWEFSQSEHYPGLVRKVDSIKNYGEAEFVKNDDKKVAMASTKSDEYFAQARLNRQKSRDEAIDTLKKMIEDGKISDTQRKEIMEQAKKLAGAIESESRIENMIKAKGFSDIMVYIQDNKVTVIVKTKGLIPKDAAKIKDIVIKETNVSPENISIVEVK